MINGQAVPLSAADMVKMVTGGHQDQPRKKAPLKKKADSIVDEVYSPQKQKTLAG